MLQRGQAPPLAASRAAPARAPGILDEDFSLSLLQLAAGEGAALLPEPQPFTFDLRAVMAAMDLPRIGVGEAAAIAEAAALAEATGGAAVAAAAAGTASATAAAGGAEREVGATSLA